jgi:hypothetical protein
MRRALLLAVVLLILCTCTTNPPRYVEGGPGAGAGTTPCREMSRVVCDTGNCGANQDFVTYQCARETVTRCEANLGCKAH